MQSAGVAHDADSNAAAVASAAISATLRSAAMGFIGRSLQIQGSEVVAVKPFLGGQAHQNANAMGAPDACPLPLALWAGLRHQFAPYPASDERPACLCGFLRP